MVTILDFVNIGAIANALLVLFGATLAVVFISAILFTGLPLFWRWWRFATSSFDPAGKDRGETPQIAQGRVGSGGTQPGGGVGGGGLPGGGGHGGK